MRIFLFLLGTLACFVMAVQSLSVASSKDFWLDEVYEVVEPLNHSVSELWTKGVNGTPSSTPLYFTVQKIFVRHALQKERAVGAGYDWRVSFRVVSAVGLALGTFLGFIILFSLSPVWAVSLPVFLGSYNFALYYGAESRIYGPWLGFSLALFAGTLRWIKTPKFWPWGFVWILLCVLNILICISAPLIIAPLVLVMIIYHRGKSTLPVGLGLLATLALFLFYRIPINGHFNLVLAIEKFNMTFISTEGLRMVEGVRKFAVFLFEIAFLLFIPQLFKSSRFKNLYGVAGAIGLSQVIAWFCILNIQNGVGYFYAARHGIFLLGAQALVSGALVLCIYEIAGKFSRVLAGVVVALCFLNWFNWRIKTLPEAWATVAASKKAYCHGPVAVPPDKDPLTAVNVSRFNIVNKSRHSGACLTGPGTFDYSPQWIYEN